MEIVIVAAVVLIALVVVAAPLRPGASHRAIAAEEAERAELEALKEAKLREIRELELDFRTGKLDDAGYRAQNRALRAEAVAILKKLDALTPADPVPRTETAGERELEKTPT